MAKKISELPSTDYVGDNDVVPIVQSGMTKKVPANLLGQGVNIIDNLISDDAASALSAKQGKVLKQLIDAVSAGVNIDVGSNYAKIGRLLIRWGIVENITVPASSYTAYTVNYSDIGYTYSEIPTHTSVSPLGNYYVIANVTGRAIGGFNINVRSGDNIQRTGRSVTWVSVGLTD